MVCLSCTATGERVMLAAEGFGNRHCFLENIADKNIPPDLSQCVFVIEQALSVRALQELVTAAGSESVCFTCTHLKLQTHIHTFSVSVLRSRSPPLSLCFALVIWRTKDNFFFTCSDHSSIFAFLNMSRLHDFHSTKKIRSIHLPNIQLEIRRKKSTTIFSVRIFQITLFRRYSNARSSVWLLQFFLYELWLGNFFSYILLQFEKVFFCLKICRKGKLCIGN